MSHPSIANVFDAGVSEGGLRCFVMEYVNGPSLTECCDARRLPIEDRIKLFIQAREAVNHAHQKGIIRRDLNPGNVLVAEVDGAPL
jgi:serine/threonine protein kinase